MKTTTDSFQSCKERTLAGNHFAVLFSLKNVLPTGYTLKMTGFLKELQDQPIYVTDCGYL